ncbi:hypothetical protein BDW68DRAFT_171320 [Aspergillus falconensis]
MKVLAALSTVFFATFVVAMPVMERDIQYENYVGKRQGILIKCPSAVLRLVCKIANAWFIKACTASQVFWLVANCSIDMFLALV